MKTETKGLFRFLPKVIAYLIKLAIYHFALVGALLVISGDFETLSLRKMKFFTGLAVGFILFSGFFLAIAYSLSEKLNSNLIKRYQFMCIGLLLALVVFGVLFGDMKFSSDYLAVLACGVIIIAIVEFIWARLSYSFRRSRSEA